MPYKPKMTPKAASRARATGKAQAQTRRQMASPGRTTDAGAGSVASSAARLAISLANKAAGVSSNTKRSTGFMSAATKVASKPKRRIGTIGQAQGSVKAKAGKAIKAERKATGESLYDKKYYGKPSVNQRKPSAKVKPSSGRVSSRPNPKPRKGNQR